MGYNDWYSETDSTVILGNIQDENAANAVEGTVVNTEFLATYFGQRLIDLSDVLGAYPHHAASSIYKAGARGGFPLFQIPATSAELTNDANNRYCQIAEDVPELFSNADLGDGDQILGTFYVRVSGDGYLGEWDSLKAFYRQDLSYSVHVDRANPSRLSGTLPAFDTAPYTDSSTFEISFQAGASSSSGSGFTGNVSVFGPLGSGAEYTNWGTMIDAVESTLDSTNQHTILVMPGNYDVSTLPWLAHDHKTYTGTVERYLQHKLRVPSYVHVRGVDRRTTRFILDSTDTFFTQGTLSGTADSTVAGGNPSLFLAAQFSSINNLTIDVNNQIVSPDPKISMPSPIRFAPDSSTPYLTDQTSQNLTSQYYGVSDKDYYSAGTLLHPLFVCEDVDFKMTGWGNLTTCVFSGRNRVSLEASFPVDEWPLSVWDKAQNSACNIFDSASIYFKNCKIKDSTIRVNVYAGGLPYALIPYGETLGCDYATVVVDGLEYEYDRNIPPEENADSTHGFPVVGSNHFVIVASREPKVGKIFNNCKFSAPNMWAPTSDSTVHLFNKYSFSYCGPNSGYSPSRMEREHQQYRDFPALITILDHYSIPSGNDFGRSLVQFNGCDLYINGRNHPQYGDDSILDGVGTSDPPYVDSTTYASEFCVAAMDTEMMDIEFNGCRMSNYFDSPYSGLILAGNIQKGGNTANPQSHITLNNCRGRSIGYSFMSLGMGDDSEQPTGCLFNFSGGKYTSFKSPIVKSTYRDVVSDAGRLQMYSPIHIYASKTTFELVPHHYLTSSINQSNPRNAAPLWLDSTTIGGLMQFDTTADVGVFYDCVFTTPSLKSLNAFNIPAGWFGIDADWQSIVRGNFEFGGFVCFYQDSTTWSDDRFQFINCDFISDWLPALRCNTLFSNSATLYSTSTDLAPAVIAGCNMYSDTTHADTRDTNLSYIGGSSASNNFFGSFLKAPDTLYTRGVV